MANGMMLTAATNGTMFVKRKVRSSHIMIRDQVTLWGHLFSTERGIGGVGGGEWEREGEVERKCKICCPSRSCILLARLKFELTNQDSAGRKNITVLTSTYVNRKVIEIRQTFPIGYAIK